VDATKGDRLLVRGRHIGEPDRDATILEARGQDGGPPYLVRWSDNGHEGLFFPGGDVSVQQHEQPHAVRI
jgi:hypothetical protein